MKAIIPAAGYATRLYPLTLNKPKPLLEIGGKPMIEHVIEKIEQIKEVDQIIVVTNDKFYENFLEWEQEFNSGIPIKILNDKTKSNETRLGSIGDIYFAISELNISDDIIIINSDNLFTFSLIPIHNKFLEEKNNVIALFDVRLKSEAAKMGVPDVGDDNRIVGFVEKPQQPKTTLISVGIYIYNKKTTQLFKKYIKEGNSPDKTGEFIEWLYDKEPIYGYNYNDPQDKWYDIGTIEILEAVREEYK